jgi:Tannase-like family of unknown function (DUF6351)
MRARVLIAVALLTLLGAAGTADAAQPRLKLKVVSNRADLISAGEALVEVRIPAGIDAAAVRVRDDRRNVTRSFAIRPNGRFQGLVKRLEVGPNAVTARAPGARGSRVTVTNHPNGGPVFSGPQVQPWVCQETAVDEQCNQAAEYEFQYRTTSGGFAPYDPEDPPQDVAETTTDEGETVPYIVRIETGYQDRDQYKIAVLYDPSKPWKPWRPQPGWNHKLLITHGASCGIERQAGEAPDVLDDTALSRGFAVMSTALNNAGHNCNLATQAESLVMAKERLVERYGPIRYTIGTGCSGGSLTQQQVANAYPGIYQGILPACSFPDAWSTGQQLAGYNLIRRYVENPASWAPGVAWDPASIAAVEGHPNHVNSIVFDTVYWTDLGVPDDGCAGVPDEEVYDPESRPGGVRCTLADYMINVFGPRPESIWTEPEAAAGHGFAGIPLDNVGVQFGLRALEKGQITPAQFVDLNEKIGGLTVDAEPKPERDAGGDETTFARAYRTGAVNSANNLDQVAIIDLRGPDHGIFHDAYRSWAIRARLEREHGSFANQVIWMGHVPLLGDPRFPSEALVAMDRWLAAVEEDRGGESLAARIVANRPPDLQDRCSQIPSVERLEVPGLGRVCELEHVQSRYGTPATVAGEGVATDTNKCALKPLRRADYYPVAFTDEQWARLETTFPTGVCDWGRPGVGQQGAVPWMSYQDGAEGPVIYGGRPLGPAPAGSGEGWTSRAFASWRK